MLLLITLVSAAAAADPAVLAITALPMGIVIGGTIVMLRALGRGSRARRSDGRAPARYRAIAVVWSVAVAATGFTMLEGEGTLFADPVFRSLFEAHSDEGAGAAADAAGRFFGILLPYGTTLGLIAGLLVLLVGCPLAVLVLMRRDAAAAERRRDPRAPVRPPVG